MASNPLAEAGPTPAPTPPTRVARDTIVTVLSTMSAMDTSTGAAQPAKVNVGPIIGGLVGGIVAGLAAIAFVWWYVRHRKKNREAARRAYIRRKHKQMAAHAKARSQYSASSSIYSGTLLKTPSPTEKNFDPSVPFPPPRRTYMRAKEYDPYSSDRGYGYEPQMIVPLGGQYDLQAGYDERLIMGTGTEVMVEHPDIDHYNQYYVQDGHRRSTSSQHRASTTQQQRISQTNPAPVTRTKSTKSIKRKSVPCLQPSSSSSDSPSSPGSSPPMSPPAEAEEWMQRSQRGVLRAAAANQAAANASSPVSNRHRPSRSSPLAAATAGLQSAMKFPAPALGHSPPISDDSGLSHAYAAAAQGAWGIAPNEGGMDFSRGSYYGADSEPAVQATVAGGLSVAEARHLSPPPDAFTEYGQYIGGIEAGLGADDVVGREPKNAGWI